MSIEAKAAAIQLLLGDETNESIRRIFTKAFPGVFVMIGQDVRDVSIRSMLISALADQRRITASLSGGSGLGAIATSNLARESEQATKHLETQFWTLGLL